MQQAYDLIEAGSLPHRHSHACLVVDEAGAAEIEFSFFDYQRQAYIGESGLSPQPFFFPARKRTLADGRSGYVVGPEVTRLLRRDARFGVASREGCLGDLRCKVRTYGADVAGASAIDFGQVDKPPDPPALSSWHSPPPESPGHDKEGGTNSKGEALEASRRSFEGEPARTGPRRVTPLQVIYILMCTTLLAHWVFKLVAPHPSTTSGEKLTEARNEFRNKELMLQDLAGVTLEWPSYDDLDLEIECAGGGVISPKKQSSGKQAGCGDGSSDVDANDIRQPESNRTNMPVEHIGWHEMPKGQYRVRIFPTGVRNGNPIPYKVTLRLKGAPPVECEGMVRWDAQKGVGYAQYAINFDPYSKGPLQCRYEDDQLHSCKPNEGCGK